MNMPEWMFQIIVGAAFVGLVSTIYSQMLTKSEHGKWCHKNTEEIRVFFQEELKQFEDKLDLKIENAILKAIKKLNGKGEKK
jgi:ferredoxin-fold anticodon binding domain-containing protein